MSLEQDMRDLKNALQELTATLKAFPPAFKKPETVSAIVNWDAPDYGGYGKDIRTPEKEKAEVAPPKPTTTPEIIPMVSTTTTPAGSSNTIDYAQVAKAITDTFKVDRAKVITALAKFGAAKGPQLKPENYAAFLKELTA